MEERFWYLLTHYLSKESSLEENEELKDLISSDPRYKQLFEQHGGLWNGIIKSKPQITFDKEKIKSKVLSDISINKTARVKPSFPMLKYAAVILSLIISGTVFYAAFDSEDPMIESQPISKTTGTNQRAMITLEDGTEVWLQENSTVTYADELIQEGKRQVQLTGEAYFKVTKNADFPFVVQTGTVYTKVLGTSFNVRAFPKNDIEVTVETGKVQVSNQKTGIDLRPNEQAVINSLTSEIQKHSVPSKYITVWKDQELILDMVSLEKAFLMIGRYYNVSINVDDVKSLACPVRSKYENESLETVLQGLQLIFDIDYELINDKQIRITGTGCNSKALGI